MNKLKKLFFSLLFVMTFVVSLDIHAQTLVSTGIAKGYNGEITLKTEIKEDKIINITVEKHKETKGVGDIAIPKISKKIIDKQSLDVDNIAGATITSKAVISAVVDSMKNAKIDYKKYGYKGENLKSDEISHKLNIEKLPKKKKITETIIIKDAKGRDVEIGLPISSYAISTMDVIEYIIPLKNKEAFDMLVGSGEDGGHGFSKYAKLYTPVVGNYIEHTAKISEHASPFDLEMILTVQPDILIVNSAMAAHKYALEIEKQLAEAGIKIILIDVPGKNIEKSAQQAMSILGKVFQEEKKAKEVNQFLDSQYSLITSKKLKNKEKQPTVYYEKSGYSEIFGPTATSKTGWGIPINIAGGNNIADEILENTIASKGSGNKIDPEYVLKSNPDFIILSGINDGWLDSVKEKKKIKFDIINRNGWKNLKAVKEHKLYEFAHSTSRSIYAFYPTLKMATLFYPNEFKDVDPEKNLDEFFDRFMILKSDISTWVIDLNDYENKK